MRGVKLLFTAAFMMLLGNLTANHILGGNITYECLGANQYGITLTLYKDCFGATPAPVQENLFFIPNAGCALPFSATLPLQGETEISDLCASELVNSSCNGGFNPGAIQVTYYGEITLTDACVWTMSYGSGDWNYFINMDNGMLPTAYIATTLDPTSVGCVDSVVPSNPLPVNYSCTGDAVVYDLGISNPNGYDLTYTLVCPQTSGAVNAPMVEPCGELIPGIAIDPVTGEISFTAPNLFGNYAVSVQVDMFNGGNFVGSINHTVAFTVRLCVETPTLFEDPLVQSLTEGGVQVSDTEIQACVGDSLCFTVEAVNGNIFRAIDMSSDFETLFPNGTFAQTGSNPAIGTFCLLVDESMVGSTDIAISAIDDACVNPSLAEAIVTLTVSPAAVLDIQDAVICFGETLDLVASGDTDFQWNVISGDPNPGLIGTNPNQSISPTEDTEIEVLALNADPACPAADTLFVEVSLSDFIAQIVDETCAQNDGSINLQVVGGSGNYSYNWPTIPFNADNPTGLSGGDYEVTVSDDDLPGCERSETYTIDTTPPPSGSVSGEATICEGDCADLVFDLQGTGPFTIELLNETTGALEAIPALNDGDVFEVCPTETTTYTLQLITDANNPACTYNIPSSVTITVRPTVTAGFLQPTAICEGDDLTLEVSIDQPGNFVIEYSPIDGLPAGPTTLANGDLISFAQANAGNYELTAVTYPDAPTCLGTLLPAVNLAVNELPTASIPAAVSVCEGQDLSITIETTGTGPWELEHDLPGAPSPLAINASPFNWNIGSLPATTSIAFGNLLDLGTNCILDVNLTTDVTVNALPGGSVPADASVCFDESFDLVFTLDGTGPFNLTWSDGTDSFVENGVDTGFLVSLDPDGTTSYCLDQVEDALGCIATPNSCLTLTEIPAASASFTETQADVCLGDCYELSFNYQDASGPFEWVLEFTDSNGSTQNNYLLAAGESISICPTEDVEITMVSLLDQASSCFADLSASAAIDLTVLPISTASLTGTADLCAGECVDVSVALQDASGPVDFTLGGVNYGGLDPVLDFPGGFFTVEFCPLASESIVLSNYVDQGNACSTIASDEVVLTVAPLPQANLLLPPFICEGEDGGMSFEITSTGPVDIEIEVDNGIDPSSVLNLQGVADGDAFVQNPASTTSYTILSVSDPNTPTNCSTQPLSQNTLTVGTPLEVQLQDTLCAPTALSYQFSFVISGGDPATYAVDVPGSLEDFNGGPEQLYTSDPLVPEDGAVFNITDLFGCGPGLITIDPFSCPILTFPGTVDLTPVILCENEVLQTVHNSDEILDPNDVLSFIIHSEPGNTLGVVYAISDVPQWNIADLDFGGALDYGQTYYLSAVAGDDDGSGVVDLGADVINVSEGMPFTVLQSPSASISGDATICEGETSTLTVDFLGDGPYTLAWAVNGVESPDSPVTDLDPPSYEFEVGEEGSYTLLSVSNAGCEGAVDGSAEIIVNPLPTATLSGGGSLCEGESLVLDLELLGSPDWSVTFGQDTSGDGVADNSQVVVFTDAQSTFEVQDAGDWFVLSVTDATACSNDAPGELLSVEVVPLPSATFAFGDSSYCEGASIDIELELSGAAPYSLDYGINGAPTTSQIDGDTFSFETSEGGFICLSTLTDANNCLATLNECIELTLIPPPEVLTGGDATICVGEVIELGDAPVGGYEYTWSNPDLLIGADASAPSFEGPESDQSESYTFTLTVDAEGCSDSDEVTITVEPLPIASAGDDLFICEGDDVGLLAEGGLTYQWTDNGSFLQGGLDTANPIVQPDQTQEFFVTVTDANNCSAEASVIVNVNPSISAVVDATEELCFGECAGNIELTPEGGYGDYTIVWDDPTLQGFAPTDLCPGDYAYTITDGEECTFSESISLAELPPYFVQDLLVVDPVCSGSESGSLEVIAPTAVSFTIEETQASNASGLFGGLPAGFYTVTVEDAAGCIADTTATLTDVSAPINIQVDNDAFVVCVDEEVSVLAEADGGFGALSYQWYSAEVNPLSSANPYVFTPSEDIDLFVFAEDELGCNSDTLTVSVTFSNPILAVAGPSEVIEICEEECIDLFVEASGGNGALDIEWVATSLDNEIVGTSAAINVCPPSINQVEYVVTVSDGCALPVLDTILVTIFDVPIPEIEIDVTEGCFPLTVTFVNLTDESFLGNCEWDFGNGVTLASCDTVEFTYAEPGIYQPSLSVVAPNGCSGQGLSALPVTVSDYPVADFSWTPERLSTIDGFVAFTNLSLDAVEYEWTFPGLGGEASNEFEPTMEFPPVDGVDWEVCLLAVNEFGCRDSICYFIEMESEILVYVPNAFTPDNDGLNELFMPVVGGGVDPSDFKFSVWDRWGHKVFETTRIGEGWNGSFQGGTHYTQHDAFVWILEFKDIETSEKQVMKGHVVLVR